MKYYIHKEKCRSISISGKEIKKTSRYIYSSSYKIKGFIEEYADFADCFSYKRVNNYQHDSIDNAIETINKLKELESYNN